MLEMLTGVAKRFWKDLIKKELILVKLLYLLLVGANNSLFPYLTLHLRSLGITLAQTALVYALLPLVTWPGPSIAGYIADRLGKVKVLFSSCLVLSAIFANCLLLVPAVSQIESPETVLNVSLANTSKAGVLSLIGQIDDCIPRLSSNASVILWRCWPTDEGGLNATLLLEAPEEAGTLANVGGEVFEQRDTSSIFCWVSIERGALCNDDHKKVVDPSFTLWLYFGIRMVSNLMIGITSMFNEALCLIAIKQHDGDYGLLRLWGSVGACIFSPLAGALIDISNYSSAFYLYGCIKVILAGLLYFVPLVGRPPATKLHKNMRLLLCNGQVIAFLAVMFCAGVLWGLLENYLFVFLDESLHATKSLMGLTVTVGNLAGMPFYLVSTPFLTRFGHVNLIVAGFLCYSVRYVGYSLIQDPYWCLPFEFLEALTNGLMMVAAVTYAALVAPPSVLATMQGMWAGLYYTLGKGAGGLAGGLLFSALGARVTFRALAGFSLGVGTIYSLVYHCILRSHTTVADQQKAQEANGIATVANCAEKLDGVKLDAGMETDSQKTERPGEKNKLKSGGHELNGMDKLNTIDAPNGTCKVDESENPNGVQKPNEKDVPNRMGELYTIPTPEENVQCTKL